MNTLKNRLYIMFTLSVKTNLCNIVKPTLVNKGYRCATETWCSTTARRILIGNNRNLANEDGIFHVNFFFVFDRYGGNTACTYFCFSSLCFTAPNVPYICVCGARVAQIHVFSVALRQQLLSTHVSESVQHHSAHHLGWPLRHASDLLHSDRSAIRSRCQIIAARDLT